MDIQKQHEDFDLWWEGNAIAMMCEEDEALKIWQAAKPQAVPEGFVLVPVETLNEALSWANCASNESWSDEHRGEIDKHYEVIENAMIEAQVPNQPTQFNLDEFLTIEEKLKHKGGVITADLDRFIAYAESVLIQAKALKEPK